MKSLFSILLVLLLVGCAAPPKNTMTPMQIQAMQTREYDVGKDIAFAATLSVFQDLGYIIESADKETGFITGGSPTDTRLNWFTFATNSKTTRVTSFIEELRPNFTRVRVTFVNSTSTSSSYGQFSEQDQVILEAGAYQTAFNRIDNEIFVRKGTH